jgi:cysteinyl-tRNA synthetase
MYVCGPTVYKPSHIGHMVGPVIFDTVKRYLTYLGYQVTFVVNITDVDDKLIKRANEEGTTVKDLAERMTADYLACLAQLNVTGIDVMPRATEHIKEMIALIGQLIEKGAAYPAGGDVYFDITKDADYGKLCNRDPEQLESGARVEVSDRKRNPGDFALWKGAKPGEPQWDSPWGPGRPGWHIECSAMSMKILGQTLDIHGGGLDLQFPHHENELAQSESATDRPFATYWMHNGLLKMGDVKMAGSVGNVINVVDLLKAHRPETVRFLLLGTHYRSPIEYSPDRLQEVRRSLEGFYRFFERYQRITKTTFYSLIAPTRREAFRGEGPFLGAVADLRARFLDCMDDDFNTGGAVGVLYELLTALNKFADEQRLEGPNPVEGAKAEFERGVLVLRELSAILGVFHQPDSSQGGNDQLVGALMQLVIDLRDGLRKQADEAEPAMKKQFYQHTDLIRQRLGELKIILEDRPGGTDWRFGEPPPPKTKKKKA